MNDKLKDIHEFFTINSRIAVALSGGVDSAVLLYLAEKYGKSVKAYFVKSEFQPAFELDDALSICNTLNAKLEIIDLSVLSDDSIVSNPQNRCYYCKKAIFGSIVQKAKSDGYDIVLEGTNATDDIADRPGYKALQEMGVISPLRLYGFTKCDIRQLAKENNIPVSSKPSYACLATRVPTGMQITEEILHITEKAERELFSLGFSNFRVRYCDGNALLQITEDDFPLFAGKRKDILEILGRYYNNITLDSKFRSSNE